jgi:NAD(P)-dependent dehydrogenase (short-subunit alcohol dehydrogenase family)
MAAISGRVSCAQKMIQANRAPDKRYRKSPLRPLLRHTAGLTERQKKRCGSISEITVEEELTDGFQRAEEQTGISVLPFAEPMDAPLSKRVALVTGGAVRIGRAIALRLATEGADVVVHYHSSELPARELVREIEKLGRRSVALRADLSNVAEIRALFLQVERQFGRLDILVNSAANFLSAHVSETNEELWDATLDTNLKAPFFCAQAAAPLLKQSKGVIINLADIGGILAWPNYVAYCVSKAGVIMLTRCLAKSLGPEIRVNAIAPGTITMPNDASEIEADYIKRAPLRRTGTPEDVAGAAAFLIQSDFVTGEVLILDGGRTL